MTGYNKLDPLRIDQHHPGRQNAPTEPVYGIAHEMVHSAEVNTARNIMQADGLTGNPNNWSAGARKPFGR